MPVSSSDEEDDYTIFSQEVQPDPDPTEHDFPASPMASYYGDVNVLADEGNGWERVPVDTGPSLGILLSTSYLFIDPASHESEVFFKSPFG